MIDSHFHIWDIKQKYYKWLSPDLKELYRTFTFKDYENASLDLNVNSCIVVQAANNLNESIVLLEIANKTPMIKGVIAWFDFESNNALKDLELLYKYKNLKGIRPMLQDISNVNWINNPKFDLIFKDLCKKDLIFEALIKQEHIDNIIIIAKKYPKLTVVINHLAKPVVDGDFESSYFFEWSRLIQELSLYKNVYCKFSGILTECTKEYSYEIIEPYLNHILKCFSSRRIIWGSDWPVINLKSNYQKWFNLSQKFLNKLDINEQNNILENNAKLIYKIDS